MELLEAFREHRYRNDVGPGVFDVHSPRDPGADAMEVLIRAAATGLAPDQVWVNPDCGLKTRSWDDVIPQLTHMVEAAVRVRS
jgi:5-methyltetrahydropteroyltriglutamate--homocysteine methyltransferase